MSKGSDPLAKKLDKLISKIDVLTAVTANLSTENQKSLEGKSQTEQIRLLAKRKLPKEAIAFLVGTTAETVSVRLSEMKSKKSRTNQEEKKE